MNPAAMKDGPLSRIIHQIGGALALHDRDGRLLAGDGQIVQWFGPLDSLVGRRCCDIYKHTALAKCPIRTSIETGEIVESEVFPRSYSGDARLLKVIAVPLLDDAGAVETVQLCVVDLSKAISAERQRSQADRVRGLPAVHSKLTELKFEAISASARDAIIMMDHRGLISYWNRAAERIFGYSLAETQGRSVEELIIPEEAREAHRRGFARFAETGKGAVIDQTLVVDADCKNGTAIKAEMSVSAVYLDGHYHALASIRDVTERERQRLKSEENERLFTTLFNSAEPMFILDDDGYILNVNSAFYSVSGYREEEVVGVDARRLVAAISQLDTEIATEGYWSGETVFLRNDDALTVLLTVTRVEPVPGSTGKYVGHFIGLADISSSDAELIRPQTLQETAQGAREIAGDLTSLLDQADRSLEAVAEDMDPVEIRTRADDVRAAVEEARALVNELHELSDRSRQDFEQTTLGTLAEELSAQAVALLGDRIHITTQVTAEDVALLVNRQSIATAFLELTNHARLRMPAAATEVTIKAGRLDPEDPALAGFTPIAETDQVFIAIVYPTGEDAAGSQDAELDALSSTDRHLTRVRREMLNTEGTLHVETDCSMTVAALILPRLTSGPGPARSPEASTEIPLVLVVDDQMPVRKVVARTLRTLGYEAVEAGDIDSAMAAIERHPNINAVVCDVWMPGERNGADLALWLREHRPKIPILLISGYFKSKAIMDRAEMAAFPKLEKPFTRSDLANELHQLIAQRH